MCYISNYIIVIWEQHYTHQRWVSIAILHHPAETNACCTEPPRVQVLLLLSKGIAQCTPTCVAHPVMCASKGKLCTSIQRRVHYCSWSTLCPIGRSWRALEQCKISTCSGYWQSALSVIRMIGRGGRVGIKPCLRGADTHISNLIFVQNTELQTDEKEQGDGYHSICKRYWHSESSIIHCDPLKWGNCIPQSSPPSMPLIITELIKIQKKGVRVWRASPGIFSIRQSLLRPNPSPQLVILADFSAPQALACPNVVNSCQRWQAESCAHNAGMYTKTRLSKLYDVQL